MRLFVAVLILALGGCASGWIDPAPRPLWIADENVIPEIPGIGQAIGRSSAAPVRVLIVHGMIVPRGGYSEHTQRRLIEELQLASGGQLDLEAHPRPVVQLQRGYRPVVYDGDYELRNRNLPLSQLAITEWRDKRGGAPRIVFYEMFWGAARDRHKYGLLNCFESRGIREDARQAMPRQPNGEAPPSVSEEEALDWWDCDRDLVAEPNTAPRQWGNGWLDDSVIVRGFPDATIVASPFGDVLRDDLQLAACVMATDTLASYNPRLGYLRAMLGGRRCALSDAIGTSRNIREAPNFGALIALRSGQFFVITESLGSYLFLDAQIRSVEQGQFRDENLYSFQMFDDATVYMFANQVSLLYLSRLQTICRDLEGNPVERCPNPLLGTQTPTGRQALHSTYVAFNDADDLLGYELPPYLAHPNDVDTGEGAFRMVNISVRNPGWRIPFLLASPMQAHTNQSENEGIIRAMVRGLCMHENGVPPEECTRPQLD